MAESSRRVGTPANTTPHPAVPRCHWAPRQGRGEGLARRHGRRGGDLGAPDATGDNLSHGALADTQEIGIALALGGFAPAIAGAAAKKKRCVLAGSPATAGRMTPRAMPDRHGFDHDPLRVLIADDNEADRELIKGCLDEAGIAAIVHEAATGPNVIALYQSVHADCVLLDIFLPGISGIEVLEQLKALDIHAPVIMLTGFGSENLAVAAMKAGAKDYMPKANVNPQSISRSIRNVVDRVAMLRKIDAQHEELESFARVLAHDLTAR